MIFRNGPEWWRLRSEFQKGLSSPNHIRNFLTSSDNITKEFIHHIKPTMSNDPQMVNDFLPELSRLNLECKCNLFFIIAIHLKFKIIRIFCRFISHSMFAYNL